MSVPTPRWLDILKETISDEKIHTYVLSTVSSITGGTFPRSRSVIHRGIITPSPSRPLLLTTTDIRSPKVDQLRENANSEATFWFPKANTQFRIVARAYVLPHLLHPWHAEFPGRSLSDGNLDLDWDLERLKIFDKVSGSLRATFVHPTPGTVMKNYEETKTWPVTLPERTQTDTEAQKRAIEQALSNFALVVLDPTEVDFLELEPILNRRTRWLKNGEEWEEQIVVP